MGSIRTKKGARRVIALLPVLGLIFLGMPALLGSAQAVAPVSAAGVSVVSTVPDGSAFAGSLSQFSVIAKATNGQGDAVQGAELDLAVTAGPNADAGKNGAQADATCVSAADGKCTLTVTPLSGKAGIDQITVWADNNADNLLSNGEPSATTSIEWFGPVFSLTLAPTTAKASTGTCIELAVTMKDELGNPVPGAKAMVSQTLASANLTIGCDPKLGGGGTSGASPYQVQTTDATDEDGVLTFGVSSDKAGAEAIEAYCPVNPITGLCDTGNVGTKDPQANATVTWSDGSGPNVVTTLSVDPSNGKGQGTSAASFTLTAKNAAGDPVGSIDVAYQVTAGPNQGAIHQDACTTGNDGTCDIGYVNAGGTGTDTLVFWVNQTSGGTNTPGPDVGEPQTTATWQWSAPPADAAISIACVGYGQADTATDCTVPTYKGSDALTVKVVDGSTPPKPIAGVVVDVATSAVTGKVTVAPLTCVTDAGGLCTLTLTDAKPTAGDGATVTATIQGTAKHAHAIVTWDAPVKQVTLTPAKITSLVHTATTWTALVTDQFVPAEPFAGVNVDFTVTGRNPSGTTGLGKTTDANGKATFTYTDTGLASANGHDAIVAASGAVNANGDQYWVTSLVPTSFKLVFGSVCSGSATTDTTMVTEAYPDPTVVPMCATAVGVNGLPLYDQDVAVTSTGVGAFTNAAGSADLGTSVTGTIGDDGRAPLFLTSKKSGEQDVAAAIGGLNAMATETWIPGRAYAVSVGGLNGKVSAAEGSQLQVVAAVTDAYGNAVSLVHVDWTASVPGIVTAPAGGQGTTDLSGLTSAMVVSNEPASSDVHATLVAGAYPGPDKTLTGDVTLTWVVPTPSLTAPSEVFQTDPTITVAWGGVDAAASYNVRYRSAGITGSFGKWTMLKTGITGTSMDATGELGATYCFRVQAVDDQANVSPWSKKGCTAIPLDDRALTRKGVWTAGTGDAYYAGTFLRTSNEGASLVLPKAKVSQLAILIDRASKGGAVQVWLDGTKLARISTKGSGKQVLVDVPLPSAMAGQLVITVSSAGKPVSIDGVAISRI
ncbi:MAG: hypothetical protein ACM3OO_06850 [Planctomycetaceae bacterium]